MIPYENWDLFVFLWLILLQMFADRFSRKKNDFFQLNIKNLGFPATARSNLFSFLVQLLINAMMISDKDS